MYEDATSKRTRSKLNASETNINDNKKNAKISGNLSRNIE